MLISLHTDCFLSLLFGTADLENPQNRPLDHPDDEAATRMTEIFPGEE